MSADKQKSRPEPEVTESAGSFVEQLRRVALAGVGAIVMAQEEMAEFVQRLIERGDLQEKDGRGVISEILAPQKGLKNIETQVNARFKDVIDTFPLLGNHELFAMRDEVKSLTHDLDRALRESRKIGGGEPVSGV